MRRRIAAAVLLFPFVTTCAFGADAPPAPAPSPTKGPHYVIYLLAGQSNMDGRAKVADLKGPLEKYAKPLPTVLVRFSAGGLKRPLRQNDGFEALRPGFSEGIPGKPGKAGKPDRPQAECFGPELGFGTRMAQAAPGDKILLIKFAEGGTSLSVDWKLDDPKKLYAHFIKFVEATEEKIKADGGDYEIRGMCWMQGESDSKLADGAYKSLLSAMIAKTRADLKLPKLPFVIGQVYDNGQRNFIISAQKAVANEVPATAFVEATGLTTFDKGTHYDAASQIELGNRFAREMLRLAPAGKK